MIEEFRQRFIDTYNIVSRERRHLNFSHSKLFATNLSPERLAALDDDPALAETIEAFASRFGRIQDTMAGKLFPRFLQAQAESPGTQLETLNRMEKLGLLTSVEQWLEARALRNRLVHEYVSDMHQLHRDLQYAGELTALFKEAHARIGNRAIQSLELSPNELELPEPDSN